jgi:predicted signal transduction protein with EAL and GGDEF domain
VGESSCSVGVSIGISLYPQDGREAKELIRAADAAMYVDKQRCNTEELQILTRSRKGCREIKDLPPAPALSGGAARPVSCYSSQRK